MSVLPLATTRLTPEEAARLVAVPAQGLAAGAGETLISSATSG